MYQLSYIMVSEVIDWSEFLACERGLLIAPAGHGKTTAIADCLNLCPEDSCHLVLTHTHAGIASLKQKFKEMNISPSKYHLETIDGFAQRYVIAFLGTSVLPSCQDKEYFSVAVKKCTEILQSTVLHKIVSLSFCGVFVDEYQDCTISQHNMILTLAQNLPLHILGDPLQGIFDFEKECIIDFNSDLPELFFKRFNLLNIPWRWAKTNPPLGDIILSLRNTLLTKLNSVEITNIPDKQFFIEIAPKHDGDFDGDYIKWRNSTIKKYETDNTLILCPSYIVRDEYGNETRKGDINDRLRFKLRFDYKHQYVLLDALDGKAYYDKSKKIDDYIELCKNSHRADKLNHFKNLLESLYINNEFINTWIRKEKRKAAYFLKKKKLEEQNQSSKLQDLYNSYVTAPSITSLYFILEYVINMKAYKNQRADFMNDILRCMSTAIEYQTSVTDAMYRQRSQIRHIGRKISGKCIGTTLLTKGLEFDTVIVLDADKFTDKRHFYVAISRACKTLVLITNQPNITFRN